MSFSSSLRYTDMDFFQTSMMEEVILVSIPEMRLGSSSKQSKTMWLLLKTALLFSIKPLSSISETMISSSTNKSRMVEPSPFLISFWKLCRGTARELNLENGTQAPRSMST